MLMICLCCNGKMEQRTPDEMDFINFRFATSRFKISVYLTNTWYDLKWDYKTLIRIFRMKWNVNRRVCLLQYISIKRERKSKCWIQPRLGDVCLISIYRSVWWPIVNNYIHAVSSDIHWILMDLLELCYYHCELLSVMDGKDKQAGASQRVGYPWLAVF